MVTVVEASRDPNLLIPPEEEEFNAKKGIVVKAGLGVVTYPLTFAKTLFQLGYEPYAMNTGRAYVAFGREAYYLPNIFSYLNSVYNERGLAAMYRGAEAAFTGTLVGGFSAYYIERYLDAHYPSIGGAAPEATDSNEDLLGDYEAFRLAIRRGVRGSVGTLIGVAIAQPFSVLMVREIAQHIGGESKYVNVLAGIVLVGSDEGPAGLFAGLVPSLIANFVRIWGLATLSYGVNRALLKIEKQTEREEDRKAIHSTRKYAPWIVPFVVNGFAYPFEVCATLLEVSGSHLAASMIPYSPPFAHWGDAYDYLKPYGLVRGARSFLREHKGPVAVGNDHRLYATNKYIA